MPFKFHISLLVLFIKCTTVIRLTEAQWVVDDHGCRTPEGNFGSCIPVKECKHIHDAIVNSSQKSIESQLQDYYCGIIGNSFKVCCPKTPISKSILNPKLSRMMEPPTHEMCVTPDKGSGLCISIKECAKITDFIQNNSPLSQNHIKKIQSYQCGTSTSSIKVCCPNEPIVTEPIIINKPPAQECSTPDKNIGICIPIRECTTIVNFIRDSPPSSLDSIESLMRYHCGTIDNSVKVCCPKSSIVVETIKKPTVLEQPPDVTNHKNLKLLPYECGQQFAIQRIIGGNKTALFEFPWMALLSYRIANEISFRCAGTIINEWHILTAAHCISHLKSLKLIGVRLGEHTISTLKDCEREPLGDDYCAPPVQDIAIAKVIPHPRYNSTSYVNDIGLVRLASPINIAAENAKPICLPITKTFRNINFNNTPLTVTGWGVTETGTKSDELLKVNILEQPEAVCRKAYINTSAEINHKQICAGGLAKHDSCAGDSGGPLQTFFNYNNDLRFVQFGIVSFGPLRCGLQGRPGVYTKIAYYMDWILDNLESHVLTEVANQ